MKKVLILNGPNLNLLGLREPEYYGTQTLEQLNRVLFSIAKQNNLLLEDKQSQSESTLITAIHEAYENKTDYLIFNPAAFTHTSIALRDALLAVKIPFIEVHITNLFSRETYRHTSYFSDIARGTISGLGTYGYHLALEAIIHEFTNIIE
ncbi:MAG: type II 3-dehydroquinate dehydratase [Gammaproteobacteria bacterium]|nr:type II 3-dehydroquinate dehydratase [Gammaproteobacteria bacterium]